MALTFVRIVYCPTINLCASRITIRMRNMDNLNRGWVGVDTEKYVENKAR